MSKGGFYSASSFWWCLLAGTFIFAFTCVSTLAQSYYSRDNNSGLSSYRTSWPGGFPPLSGDNVFSGGAITIQGYLLHGFSGKVANATYAGVETSLVIEDTLRVFGDLFIYNNATIHIKPNAVLIVHGNYYQDANVNFINEGSSIFLENWETADFPFNTSSTGKLYVAGTFRAIGSIVVPKPYTQLQTDSPSLYAFSRNTPIKTECANNNSGSMSLLDPHLHVIRWESSTDFFRSQLTTIVNEKTTQPYTNLAETTSYRVYYEKNDGSFAYSDASTIVVQDIMIGSKDSVAKVEMDAPVCEGEPVKLVAATIEGATYAWTGPDGFTSAEQNPVIPSINIAKAGLYSVIITSDGCSSQGTAEVQVTPEVKSGSVTASSSSVCSGINSAILTLSGHTGSIVRWESSTDSFNTSIVPIEYTAEELTVYDLSIRTSFRAVVSSGNCGVAASGAATIEIDNPAIGGNLSGDALVCFGDNSGVLTLSGHEGAITGWESSQDDFRTVTSIAHTAAELSYTNLLKTTSYRVVVENEGNCAPVYSTAAKITVKAPLFEGAETVNPGGTESAGDLYAVYPFNGNAADVSGGENHGGVVGAVLVADRFGAAGQAYSFDGVDDKIYTTTLYPSPGPQVFTISIWFKTTETDGGRIIGYSNSQTGWSGNFDRHLYMDDLGHLYFGIFGDWKYGTVHAAQKYNDGEWHHAVAILSPAGLKLYVDGLLMDSNTSSTVAESFSGYWRLGGDSMGGDWPSSPTNPYFKGEIDDVAIYERELDMAEVKQLSSAGLQQVCEGETLALSGPSLAGATYVWTGPNGFNSADQNPVIPDINSAHEGSYLLTISLDGCQTQINTEVTVLPAVLGGTLASGQSQFCYGANDGAISLSGHAGNVVRWESSTDHFDQDITPVAHTETEYAFSNLLQSTSFRVVVGNGNICTDEYSSVLTISVEPAVMGGVLTASAGQVCEGNNVGNLVLSGNVGAVIRWESSKDNFQSDVTSILHTMEELSFTGLTETLSYRAVVGIPSCGEAYSSVAVVEVQPAPVAGELKGSKRILPGSNSGVLQLEGYEGKILHWETSNDNFVEDVRILESTGGQFPFQDLQSSTWYRVLVGGASSCAPVYSQPAQLIINNAPEAVTDEFSIASKAFSSETSLLENDSDPDGDLLYIVSAEGLRTEAGNTVSIKADGYFYFEAAEGFSGADSFSYQLCDNAGDAMACVEGVVLLQIEGDKKVVIYQGFSPNNGDQKNNVWILKNIEHYPNNHVQVFNRYGTLVYEVKGYNNTDKVFSGYSNKGAGMGERQLPQDTYFYQIRLDEKAVALTGFVIINR